MVKSQIEILVWEEPLITGIIFYCGEIHIYHFNHSQVYNLVALDTVTMLGNHHHCLSSCQISSLSPVKTPCLLSNSPISTLPRSW